MQKIDLSQHFVITGWLGCRSLYQRSRGCRNSTSAAGDQSSRNSKVARIRSVLSDVKQQFPIECYRERIAGFWGRFVYTELVVAERLKQERRSPTQQGLAVWAEADLVTPEILEQIPVCLRKVRCR